MLFRVFIFLYKQTSLKSLWLFLGKLNDLLYPVDGESLLRPSQSQFFITRESSSFKNLTDL